MLSKEDPEKADPEKVDPETTSGSTRSSSPVATTALSNSTITAPSSGDNVPPVPPPVQADSTVLSDGSTHTHSTTTNRTTMLSLSSALNVPSTPQPFQIGSLTALSDPTLLGLTAQLDFSRLPPSDPDFLGNSASWPLTHGDYGMPYHAGAWIENWNVLSDAYGGGTSHPNSSYSFAKSQLAADISLFPNNPGPYPFELASRLNPQLANMTDTSGTSPSFASAHPYSMGAPNASIQQFLAASPDPPTQAELPMSAPQPPVTPSHPSALPGLPTSAPEPLTILPNPPARPALEGPPPNPLVPAEPQAVGGATSPTSPVSGAALADDSTVSQSARTLSKPSNTKKDTKKGKPSGGKRGTAAKTALEDGLAKPLDNGNKPVRTSKRKRKETPTLSVHVKSVTGPEVKKFKFV